jgi:hypothetical protein
MRAPAAVTLAVMASWWSAACRSPSPSPSSKSPPDRGSDQGATVTTDASTDASAAATRDQLPNARIRLRLHFQAAALPERDIEQTIWLHGSRFRVRDEVGRDVYQQLGDITYPRGLGLPATTMEEIMDREAEARRKPYGVTEVYGDLANDAGVVIPAVGKRYEGPASKLAPLARQVLAAADDPRLAALARAGDVTRLGRAAVEYKGEVEVDENGAKRRNTVVRVVAPPYLLLDDVRNAELADHYYVREVVALDEGVVTDADVTPPPAAP